MMFERQNERHKLMGNQVALLVLGFVLTSVLGGLLGYVFQRRAWSHQFDVQRRTAEREAAAAALHELSNLLEKRRYRMLIPIRRRTGQPRQWRRNDALRGGSFLRSGLPGPRGGKIRVPVRRIAV